MNWVKNYLIWYYIVILLKSNLQNWTTRTLFLFRSDDWIMQILHFDKKF